MVQPVESVGGRAGVCVAGGGAVCVEGVRGVNIRRQLDISSTTC